MNKRLLLTAAAVGIVGAGLVGASGAFAQNTTPAQDVRSSLVQKLADKFNLNTDEVQKVFDEEHDARHKLMEERYSARLDQLVKDGKITDAQKQLLLNKHEELQDEREKNRETMQNLTLEQRKAAMETKKQGLETWAQQNGIDPQYLGFFGKRGFGMKHMMNAQ